MFDQSSKKRGRVKSASSTRSKVLASTVVTPSKALGDQHDTITLSSTNHQPSIMVPDKKIEPKVSRSAQRRRSLLAAEEAHALANAVPILDMVLPLPPIILSRTYECTLVQITLIPNLSVDHYVCDFQLQVSKGGKQLDSLRPLSQSALTKKNQTLPLSESKLKWSTVKRVPFSIPKENGGNSRRFLRLTSTYNIYEKCAFRCRIRYADKGWSPWSRVSHVQQPVESGLPTFCGRCIALNRTQSSLQLKWPAPRREILEYYVEMAIVRKKDKIPTYDMEDEVKDEDLPNEEDTGRIDPLQEVQRRVLELDWIPASHICPTVNELLVNHLQPSESYRFRVRARNRAGWGSFGPSSDSYWLAPNPPGTPLRPTVLEVTPRSLTLRWNQPRLNGSKKIEAWEVAVGTNDDGWSNMDPEIVNTAIGNSYWHPGDRCAPEKMYFDDDEGEGDDDEGKDDDEEVQRPKSAYVSSASSRQPKSTSSVMANEDDSNNNDKVKLSWRPLRTRINVEPKHLFVGDLTKYCTYTFTGFAPTSPYQIRVRAFCTTGNGNYSLPSQIMFTTKEDFDIRAIVWEAKVQGIHALVELMKNPRFIENGNLQTRCVRALRLIAANQDDDGVGYEQVLRSDLLEVTLESLTNNRKDPSLLRWSCRMYTVFANEIDAVIIDLVVKHALSLIDVVAVAQWACFLLRSVVEVQGEQGATMLSAIPSALDIPLMTAQKHSLRAALYNESLECLDALVKSSKLSRKAAREKRAIDIIKVAAINQHGSSSAEKLAAKVLATLEIDGPEEESGSRPGSRGASKRRRISSAHDNLNQRSSSPNSSIMDESVHEKDNNDVVIDQMTESLQLSMQLSTQLSISNLGNLEHPFVSVTGGLEQRADSTSYLPLNDTNNTMESTSLENLYISEVQMAINITESNNERPPSSVPTTSRSVGSSLRSRLHGHEIMVFEWMEAELHRKDREVGAIPTDENSEDEDIDRILWTAEDKQQRRKERHRKKHDPDNHPWFQELNEGEGDILLGLEKELRLQRERTTLKPAFAKTEKDLMKEALQKARGDQPPSRPGTAQTHTTSIVTGNDTKYSSSLMTEDEEPFVPGQIIGKSPTEMLKDFWESYPGFENHIINLAKDGFDDLEALMLAKKEDLTEAGLGKKSAKVLLKLIKKERPYWMVVFAAQREYNFYLRSLGHDIQPLLKYEPIPEDVYVDEEGSTEYTASTYVPSEVMSELNALFDDEEFFNTNI